MIILLFLAVSLACGAAIRTPANVATPTPTVQNASQRGGILALAIDPTTPTTLYAGTIYSGVFKSTDGGESWYAIKTGLPDIEVMPWISPGIVCFGNLRLK